MTKKHKKIRILYQIHPADVMGGVEQILFDTLVHIDKTKYHPIVCSWVENKLMAKFKFHGVQTKVIDANPPERRGRLVSFIRKSKVDIVQSNNALSYAATASNIAGVPHIFYLHGDLRNIMLGLSQRQKRHFIHMASAISHHIVCNSRFSLSRLGNIKSSGIVVIHNGVDIEQKDRVRPDYTRLGTLGWAPHGQAVGMVAHFMPLKRHIDFIKAARKVKPTLPNTKFFIFGSTYPEKMSKEYSKLLYRTVAEMGMRGDIIFAGHCENISSLIAGMNLVVLPSLGEGLGMAILEAMALAKPVIGTRSGGIPELIKNNVTGYLVPPRNPGRLAGAMIEILKDPQKAKAMGSAGRKRAKRLFDIKDTAKKFERLYGQVYNRSFTR